MRRNHVPRLESLETRELLAKAAPQVSIREVAIGTSTYELLIVGTARNDVISIIDNGTGAAGNVTAYVGGTVPYMSVHGISSIGVVTGAGRDRVSYQLQGDLATGVNQAVYASSASSIIPNAPKVRGGGALNFTADVVGKVSENSDLSLLALADLRAPTTATFRQTGEIDGTLFAAAGPGTSSSMTKYKSGGVNYSFDGTGPIGVTGTLFMEGFAGSARNVLSARYAGASQGKVGVYLASSGALDRLSADVEMQTISVGVAGTLPTGIVSASGRTAQAKFIVRRGGDSTSTTGITASINTTSKRSVTQETANVLNNTAGKNTIIP